MTVELRLMRNTPGELDLVDRLMMAAYPGGSRRREVSRYLTVQPDGWFVAVDDDVVVAAAGGIAYGQFCWLGLVATLPARRRMGLATQLSLRVVEWARSRGCQTVALDASDAGRPVYERLGFQALGSTIELIAPERIQAKASEAHAVAPVGDGLGSVTGFDRRVFGGDRSALLKTLIADDQHACYVVDGSTRKEGFLVAGDGLLGPGVASHPDVATGLVRAACSHAPRPALIVPMESRYRETLLALGFSERRRLTHMRLGRLVLPGERGLLFAQASFAAG